ncbi:MAG: hypothetical protein ACK4E0_14020 [Chitinophagaceae bacterium]
MEPASYIMVVSTSNADVSLHLAIRNTAGTGRVHYGRNSEHGSTELWIIPRSRKTKEELIEKIRVMASVNKLTVVALSRPVTAGELLEVRELFGSQLGWNSSQVSDEELSLFLNTRLQGKYSYMFDLKMEQGSSSEKLRIIKAEDHPDYSPHWRVHEGVEEEILERELTMEDLEIENVRIAVSEDEPPGPMH